MDNNNLNEIPVYKDPVLLELSSNHLRLETEVIPGFSDRKKSDVRKEQILNLQAINAHLRNNYPNNSVAESYEAVNNFLIDRFKEEAI